ncbi:MAG: DUF599 domain-containing protein [Pseudomonadota bacterium]
MNFNALDLVGLLVFSLGWFGYVSLADGLYRERSITARMDAIRRDWIAGMAAREVRIVDSQIQSALMQGVGFLASTAVLMIGAMTAMLGYGDASFALSETGFDPGSIGVNGRIKVVLVAGVFAFAFFKLMWSYRLFNYCAVMMGAMPEQSAPDVDTRIEQLAQLHMLSAEHFNNGLRAYFFAIACFLWLLHAAGLAVGTLWVLWVLWRRDFSSRSRAIIGGNVRV